MGGRAPSDNRKFSDLLEQGAKVDDIFKDSPTPLGSNPFQAKDADENARQTAGAGPSIVPLSIEAVDNSPKFEKPSVVGSQAPSFEPTVSLIDNDSLFCVNRKYAAVESLFKLVTRDYLSFGQLISEILRIAMEQVKSEAGSFLEIDHQNQCMFFRAVTGRSSENLLSFTVPLGQGIAGFVCENQQPMTLSSVDDSSVYLKSISNAVGFETKTLAAYPIVIRGVSFGCLELLNRLGEAQFTDADKEVLATICEHASIVIESRLLMAAISKAAGTAKPPRKKEEDAA